MAKLESLGLTDGEIIVAIGQAASSHPAGQHFDRLPTAEAANEGSLILKVEHNSYWLIPSTYAAGFIGTAVSHPLRANNARILEELRGAGVDV